MQYASTPPMVRPVATEREVPLPPAVRAGIVGAGFMGGVHAAAVRAAGGVVAGIVDRSLEKARSLQARVQAERAYESFEDLVEAPEVEVVHLCTPNGAHAALASRALRAGKHVVCEKPLALSVEQAAELVQEAGKAGVVAVVPFVYRYYPMVREIRQRVRNGEAGTLALLHGAYLQDWLAQETDSDWRLDASLGGASRAFGDIGVHWADLAEFTSGHRISRLSARLLTLFPVRRGPTGPAPVETEDAAVVNFETDHGAVGSVVVSQVSLGQKNRFWLSLDGTKASFAFDHDNPDVLWIGGRQVSLMVSRSPESVGDAVAPYVILPAGHPQGYQDCFNLFVRDSYAAIRGRHPDGLPLFADGLRAAEITDAVLTSATERCWVEVPCSVTA
jgi:predicted dehydrogenase